MKTRRTIRDVKIGRPGKLTEAGKLMRLGKLIQFGKFAALGILLTNTLLGGLATNANAQVTRLVPLGPSQETFSAATSSFEGSRSSQPAARVESRGWAGRAELDRAVYDRRFDEPLSESWRTAEPQVARRVTYERPMRYQSEFSGETYDVRQAAYQPSTPADMAPSLNSGAAASGSWQGSSSGIVTSSPSSQPSFSTSPWTSSQGSTTLTPMPPAPAYSSPMYVQRFSNPVACPPTGIAMTASVPMAQGPVPPLLPITRPPRSLYVSNGLLGQPVIYAPGQPIRNFFRYFSF